ncbi:collagen alpha-1(XVIII) chain-like [Sapajus apella]|uniref:Collagen alpha-1(XVIII) chain-like n=1 Tax=Sapajus apella TaxID=9515 RepID=A0A6J3FTG8_SAPAP|nr:collagen alpha-1(XVIII) chain-like [Sapajus apella]
MRCLWGRPLSLRVSRVLRLLAHSGEQRRQGRNCTDSAAEGGGGPPLGREKRRCQETPGSPSPPGHVTELEARLPGTCHRGASLGALRRGGRRNSRGRPGRAGARGPERMAPTPALQSHIPKRGR